MKFFSYALGIIICFVVIVGFEETSIYAKSKVDTFALCLECHPKTKDLTMKGRVHQPLKEGKCTECHNPHVSKHPTLLSDIGSELCYNCHDRKKGFIGIVVHRPVEEGNCLVCHNAHSSDIKALLKKAGGDGCFSCHPKEGIIAKKNIHPEVRKGNCLSCHNPHASDREGLLNKDRRSLCAGCHTETVAFANMHMGYKVGGSDCLGCHSPHSSNRKGILKASLHKPFEENKCSSCHVAGSTAVVRTGMSLCVDCHKTSMEGFNKISNHLILGKNDSSCNSCHNPHASDERYLLKDKEKRVCYECHTDTKDYVAKSAHKHPKIGACLDCHVAHGSNDLFFLSKGSNTCSQEKCHETQGTFTHPIGEKIIDPRSKVAMDCSTCHNPMGSPESSILRFEKDKELCVQCHQM